MQPGESFTLRYRVLIHKGDDKEGQVREAYESNRDRFSEPARVRVAMIVLDAAAGGDPAEVAKTEENYRRDRARIEDRLATKIEQARK